MKSIKAKKALDKINTITVTIRVPRRNGKKREERDGSKIHSSSHVPNNYNVISLTNHPNKKVVFSMSLVNEGPH